MNLKNTSIVLLSILSLSDIASAAKAPTAATYTCPTEGEFTWKPFKAAPGLWEGTNPGGWSSIQLPSVSSPIATYRQHSGSKNKNDTTGEIYFSCKYNVKIETVKGKPVTTIVAGITMPLSGYTNCWVSPDQNSVSCY